MTGLLDPVASNPSPGAKNAALPAGKIILRKVGKTFATNRKTVHALQEIDLQISEGDFVCLLGPSGCGKSTLLRIVAGLEQDFTGEAMLDGVPIVGPGRDRTVMFQEHALFPWLDVMGNLMFSLKLKPGLTHRERGELARSYLELVGLQDFAHANIHELSGGMKQRVALARALAPDPSVLLMDEPFASLDSLTREQLYGDLQRINAERKKTILFVTHNVREAVCLGDRVLVFSPRPGRIRREFPVNLPRPRDFNDIGIAQLSSEISSGLKSFLSEDSAVA